jgi:hypothetical protein
MQSLADQGTGVRRVLADPDREEEAIQAPVTLPSPPCPRDAEGEQLYRLREDGVRHQAADPLIPTCGPSHTGTTLLG